MDSKRKVLSEKIFPESSLIEFMVYQYDQELLEVKYRKGKYRVYDGISEADLKSILNAGSVGKALLKHLKEKNTPPPKNKMPFGNLFSRLGITFAS